MNWIVFHIVSGHAFFTGVILLVIAAVSSTQRKPMFRRVTALAFAVGVIGVVASSTAIPYWCYGAAVTATVAWIVSRYKTSWRRWASWAVVAAWLRCAAIELPWHVTPSMQPAKTRTITVIGDSVTAGIGGDETSERWPGILAREHDVDVQDISHMGETASSALKRVRSYSINSAVVVVEIGGNDLLGSTTSAQFGRDLEALVMHLAADDRQIVMFELPLPPFCHEYGRVQRRVAVEHHVKLIPRRVFLSVISDSESTIDTIHLSPTGHQVMADCVWRLVGSAFVLTLRR